MNASCFGKGRSFFSSFTRLALWRYLGSTRMVSGNRPAGLLGPALQKIGWGGLSILILCGPVFADSTRPVRSLLEFRREHVVLQKWDLSCGAAALATLLRYQFGEKITEQEIARALMRREEYIDHPELIQLQEGFSLLDLKRYVGSLRRKTVKFDSSPKKNLTLMGTRAKRSNARVIFHHRNRIYKGEGLGQLELSDLIQRAPIIVPINAIGYNHFVVFRGAMGNRVLLADPAWGNRTMTTDKFQRMWIDYGEALGHIGFVIERIDGKKLPNRLQPQFREIIMSR
jgi:predicted double-glycine peptidase